MFGKHGPKQLVTIQNLEFSEIFKLLEVETMILVCEAKKLISNLTWMLKILCGSVSKVGILYL